LAKLPTISINKRFDEHRTYPGFLTKKGKKSGDDFVVRASALKWGINSSLQTLNYSSRST
jgi:hypothetical protein